MVKKTAILAALLFCLASAFEAEKIYFTQNGQKGGPSLEPGVEFYRIWTATGMGINGKIYVGISGQIMKYRDYPGNSCVVSFDPYTREMKTCGSIKNALIGAGNYLEGESLEKIHTHLNPTPDGKLWFGTHDEAYARGGHIMYVDIHQNETVKDYSRQQKYLYPEGEIIPVPNDPALPPSDHSGVSAQFNSIMIMGINPWNPRYMWTKTDPDNTHQLWDLIEDTTWAFRGGTGDQREFAVAKDGSIYYFQTTTAVKRTPDGGFKIAGRTTARYGGNSFTYSHSCDSAFSITHGYGEVILWDFVNDTVLEIGDLPGDRPNALCYRAVAISRDGKKLYTLGDGGKIYEFEIATGSYKAIFDVSGHISGYVMASGGSLIDTLGNMYFAVHNNAPDPLEPFLMRVHLGRDLIKPIHIPTPDEIGIADRRPKTEFSPLLNASPNPFTTTTVISVNLKDMSSRGEIQICDVRGKILKRVMCGKQQTFIWNGVGCPSGIYFIRLRLDNRVVLKKILLQK
jgi:hypothetical protein